MIKRILFAADMSVFTPHVLLQVESLAIQMDAFITVVHVVPPMSELAEAVVKAHCSTQVKREVLAKSRVDGLLDVLRDEVTESIKQNSLVDDELANRITDVVVVEGNTAAEILALAAATDADLIVVGSHGVDSLDSRLMGSVTSKILQLSRVPVFMVPMMDLAGSVGRSLASFSSRLR